MVKITYIESNGTKHIVNAEPGETLMSAAVENSVPGIDGDCGGNCACATCHLYVDGKLAGGALEEELDMLGIADGVRDNSRLGCQIIIDESMDGLMVNLPVGQH